MRGSGDLLDVSDHRTDGSVHQYRGERERREKRAGRKERSASGSVAHYYSKHFLFISIRAVVVSSLH